MASYLDDSNFVGNIKSIVVRCKLDVGLLSSVVNHGVDFSYIDVVELFHGHLNLRFVGLNINNKDQGVVVLNFFHGAFSCQWVSYNSIRIQFATESAMKKIEDNNT